MSRASRSISIVAGVLALASAACMHDGIDGYVLVVQNSSGQDVRLQLSGTLHDEFGNPIPANGVSALIPAGSERGVTPFTSVDSSPPREFVGRIDILTPDCAPMQTLGVGPGTYALEIASGGVSVTPLAEPTTRLETIAFDDPAC